jgi:hypothetical protein
MRVSGPGNETVGAPVTGAVGGPATGATEGPATCAVGDEITSSSVVSLAKSINRTGPWNFILLFRMNELENVKKCKHSNCDSRQLNCTVYMYINYPFFTSLDVSEATGEPATCAVGDETTSSSVVSLVRSINRTGPQNFILLFGMNELENVKKCKHSNCDSRQLDCTVNMYINYPFFTSLDFSECVHMHCFEARLSPAR